MQRFFALHKNTIVTLWYALLACWLLFFVATTQLLTIRDWLSWGPLSGSISLVVFWITLLPGMMKRFRLGGALIPLRTTLMLFRRQMGITMYLFALTHLLWSRILPIINLNGDLTRMSPFEAAGMLAFVLLTPVFITSNEWSVRTLGRAWHTVHALVYLVIWIVFLHVALQGTVWQTWGTFIVAVLETASLIWAKITPTKPSQTTL